MVEGLDGFQPFSDRSLAVDVPTIGPSEGRKQVVGRENAQEAFLVIHNGDDGNALALF